MPARTKVGRKKSSMRKRGESLMKQRSSELRQTSMSVESLASTTSETSDETKTLLTNVYESPSDFQKAFEKYCEMKVEARVKRYEDCVEYVNTMFSNFIKIYPESYLNLVTTSFVDVSTLPNENIDPNNKPTTTGTRKSRLQASKKERTEFKKPRTPSKDRSSRKRSLSVPTPPAPQPVVFMTPLNSQRQQMAMVKSITPKVSATPVSVMRRPQHGEVAFSTSGSPLLIGAVSREDIPTISVPLQDGRVFSILPDPGLPPEDLPEFDEDTKKFLKTLREHLKILSNSP